MFTFFNSFFTRKMLYQALFIHTSDYLCDRLMGAKVLLLCNSIHNKECIFCYTQCMLGSMTQYKNTVNTKFVMHSVFWEHHLHNTIAK